MLHKPRSAGNVRHRVDPSVGRISSVRGSLAAIVALSCAFLLSSSLSSLFAERTVVLAREKSPYAIVSVVEKGRLRFLKLDDRVQSAMDPGHPYHMPYTYSQLMGTAVAAWPGSATDRPVQVLIIGLGGGTLSRHLTHRYPRAEIHVAELDPVVVKFARQFFALDRRVRVHVGDGRRHLADNTKRYDVIALDAFGPDYIPPALMTQEFLELVRSRLTPGGLLCVNTWVSSRWSLHETRTYQEVFPVVLELLHPDEPTSNRILIAGPSVPSVDEVKAHALATEQRKRFAEFSVKHILEGLRRLDVRPPVAVLTDSNVHSLIKK